MDEPKKGSKATKWIVGCIVTAILLVGCCGGGAYFGYLKLIDFGHAAMVEAVNESNLPADQKASIVTDLGRLKDAVKDRRLGLEAFEGMEEEMQTLAVLGMVTFYENTVIETTDLTDEEKVDFTLQLQRLARGIDEGDITLQEFSSLNIRANNQNGQTTWNPDDVRHDVEKVRKLVDEKEIASEPYSVDVAARFTEIVDALIDESGSVEPEADGTF